MRGERVRRRGARLAEGALIIDLLTCRCCSDASAHCPAHWRRHWHRLRKSSDPDTLGDSPDMIWLTYGSTFHRILILALVIYTGFAIPVRGSFNACYVRCCKVERTTNRASTTRHARMDSLVQLHRSHRVWIRIPHVGYRSVYFERSRVAVRLMISPDALTSVAQDQRVLRTQLHMQPVHPSWQRLRRCDRNF